MDIVRYQILLHLFQLIDQQPMMVPSIGLVHTDSSLPFTAPTKAQNPLAPALPHSLAPFGKVLSHAN